MILHCSSEASPAFLGGTTAAMAHGSPKPALTAWIVMFERDEGIKGKPLSGGKAALDALAAFKKAGHPSDQGLTAAAFYCASKARAPPLCQFRTRARARGALDVGPHMRVGKGALDKSRANTDSDAPLPTLTHIAALTAWAKSRLRFPGRRGFERDFAHPTTG